LERSAFTIVLLTANCAGPWSRGVNRPSLEEFIEPNWQAPLDMQKVLNTISDSCTITGMFLEPTAREARKKGTPLPSARDKYLTFRFYPLREHVQLLIEACAIFYPGRPARVALRKLGRAAPGALLTTTFGKVCVASAQSTHDLIGALAKSYSVNVPGCAVESVDMGPKASMVRMQDVQFFADSHHVGVFEGVMRYSGVHGEIKVRSFGPKDIDLLCSWK
jgi:uncharacterized protein (TIGR02265 family)